MYFRIASRYGNVKITLYYFVFVRTVVCVKWWNKIKSNQNFPGQVWWHAMAWCQSNFNKFIIIQLFTVCSPSYWTSQSFLKPNPAWVAMELKYSISMMNNSTSPLWQWEPPAWGPTLFIFMSTAISGARRGLTDVLFVRFYLNAFINHWGKFIIRLIVLSILPLVTVSTLNVLIYNALVKSNTHHIDDSR